MLRRHPLLLAEWLALRNLLRGRGHMRRKSCSLCLGDASARLVVLLLTLRSHFPRVVRRLARRIACWLIAVIGCRMRSQPWVSSGERAEVRYTQFWLAAAPVRQYSRTLAILVVSSAAARAQLLAVGVLLAAMGVAGRVDATRRQSRCSGSPVARSIGATVGWWSARRSRADAMEGSRYVRKVKARTHTIPSAAAVSGWPLAQVRAWGRPENLRILLLIAHARGSSRLVRGSSV